MYDEKLFSRNNLKTKRIRKYVMVFVFIFNNSYWTYKHIRTHTDTEVCKFVNLWKFLYT